MTENGAERMADIIVVGYDGSPAGVAALHWAADEAALRRARLRLTYVLPRPTMTGPMGTGSPLPTEPLRHNAELLLDRVRAEIPGTHPGLVVEALVVFGEAAPALLQQATDGALVVLGSRGLGEFRDLAMGSVAAHVATHADCPVVVVPAGWAPHEASGGVVVGVDGSELSVAAIDFAFGAAEDRRLPVTAVMAWHDPVRLGHGDQLPLVYDLDMLEQENTALLAESVAGHAERYSDLEVRRELVRGHATDVLIAAAKAAELLVVGSRGRGAFAGLLLGSTSRALVHHAPCPVAVVR
ncbi:universal stress protein [Kribbella amoyensis]|uniref:universal stress protein n=1 Tax=Kribbella amoyensis TaxID=996641 RepID=UPI001EE36670|nr:universal stress protein [Kribbella amoyensis]